jgi:superfamily I DNA/RNA helicase
MRKYYDMVIQDTLEKLPGSTLQYDAILVDEGQDFSDAMLKIVMALLNPATNHLAIALDENQNIYQRRRSWKEMGIQARGRVHRVTWVYRNTREIADFAAALVGNGASAPEASDAAGHQGRLFPETFEAPHGAPPDIRAFSDYRKIADWVAGKIRQLAAEEGYPLSEIAVLYAMKTPQNDPALSLPLLIAKALDKKGLLHNWISEDYRAKRSCDITTKSVTISTIHSVKGFDYACVFLLGLDWLTPGARWSEEQIRKLVYVAANKGQGTAFYPILRRK